MGEDGAEGLPRETRGVDHDGGVVARQLRDLLREGASGDDLPEGGCIVRAVGRDDVAAEREFVPYLVKALRQRCLRDQAPGVAVAQKMRQFVRRGLDIEGYGDAADLLDSEIGDDKLGAVGEHQGYLVSLPEAEGAQMVSQGAGGPVQLPIGDLPFAMDDGNIFRKVLGALRQHASQTHDFSTPESAGERVPAACRGLRELRRRKSFLVRIEDSPQRAAGASNFRSSLAQGEKTFQPNKNIDGPLSLRQV